MKLRAALLAGTALALCLAATARASPGYEVGIEDDRLMLGNPIGAPLLAAEWKAQGVDIVRLIAVWGAIAPGRTHRTPPAGFDPVDPKSPGYDWSALDTAVGAASRAGLRVMLTVTGPGPLWTSRNPAHGDPRWRPDPRQFAHFATAVARRYGSAVDRYLIWNEPNQGSWLRPQGLCSGRRCRPVAPSLYRGLVRYAYPAIKAADPGAQVLIGELAPIGLHTGRSSRSLRPLDFLRSFGCVNSRYRPIRQKECAHFRPAPADGFGYHPHGKRRAPDQPNPDPDQAQIADLPRLLKALDRVVAHGGIRAHGGRHLGLYLTEFAYQTMPPDFGDGVAPSLQARWLQQAAFLAWRNPRVKNLTQYEWRDEPIRRAGPGKLAYAGWQSGLYYASGRPKPSAAVFRHPFWIQRRPSGRSARFWGQVRPGDRHTVTLERRKAGRRTWVAIARVGSDAHGNWTLVRKLPFRADYRFAYELPSLLPGGPPVAAHSGVLSAQPR